LRDSNPGTTRRTSLTSGYAPIAAQPGYWPHPPIEHPARTRRNAATREYAPSYAVYEGAYVDLVQAYSNLPDHVERLRSLLEPPRAARLRGPERPPKQAQRRLNPDGVAELVAACKAGGRVKKLAAEFGIHRDTVHNVLKREGVLQSPGVRPDDLPEAIRLYEEGWSLARLAVKLDVSPSTVNRALRKAGVPIRRPGTPRL